MKRLLSFILVLLLLSLTSCGEERSAYEILLKFSSDYGAQGIIYSPEIGEGQDGYIHDELIQRVYMFSDDAPDNFAILLNSRIDSPSECGVFVCRDNTELYAAEEICLERIRLLASDRGFVKRRGRVLYYSTLSDPDRAERIFKEILR